MKKNRLDDVTAWLCLMLFLILFLISIASIIFTLSLPKQTSEHAAPETCQEQLP